MADVVSETVPLLLRDFHRRRGATFTAVNGGEVVAGYGDVIAEHAALRNTAGVMDLSFRSRLCLTGADRVRFLHGQVTNDVKKLRGGEGCYAALTTAKGKLQSDLNLYCLQDELLLDFEPGLTAVVTQRLEKYLVADEVQVVDVAAHYGLLTVQGPQAAAVVRAVGIFTELPAKLLAFVKLAEPTLGEIYLVNHARVGSAGFDVFIPNAALETVAEKFFTATQTIGGCGCGWDALEIARVEAGVPRFGVDMDENNLASECGIEARAISYHKGCYIGQEVLNRIHSVGHVNRELRGLRLPPELRTLPVRGDKLFHNETEVGHVTSAVFPPGQTGGLALGYVRREANAVGTELVLKSGGTCCTVSVAELPFARS